MFCLYHQLSPVFINLIKEYLYLSCLCCVLSRFSCVLLFVTPWSVPTRLSCWRDSPGKNTGVSCHAILQGIFLTEGSNLHLLCLLHWQAGSLPLVAFGKSLIPISIFLLSVCLSLWIYLAINLFTSSFLFLAMFHPNIN